jgi:hypothetical protein
LAVLTWAGGFFILFAVLISPVMLFFGITFFFSALDLLVDRFLILSFYFSSIAFFFISSETTSNEGPSWDYFLAVFLRGIGVFFSF